MRGWRWAMRGGSEPMPELLDREEERAALDGLLEDLRSGRGRVLVVRGEAGVGKSALLDYLARAAAGVRVGGGEGGVGRWGLRVYRAGAGGGVGVARAAGVESEMELAFAGLHLL